MMILGLTYPNLGLIWLKKPVPYLKMVKIGVFGRFLAVFDGFLGVAEFFDH